MENKLAILGIFIDGTSSADKVNSILHEYANYIIGRLGIPYREKGLSIISVVMDAPQDIISALAGKLGRISGVSSKTMQAKI